MYFKIQCRLIFHYILFIFAKGFSVNQLDGPPNGNIGKGQNSTKVLYFTDKTVNPCMCTIQKRLV